MDGATARCDFCALNDFDAQVAHVTCGAASTLHQNRASTAGAVVVGGVTQKRDQPNPATYIGKGKLDELVQEVGRTDADVVIFDNELSPAQIRNIEKTLEIKVLDRSELILDIFATRAQVRMTAATRAAASAAPARIKAVRMAKQ